MPTLEAVFRVFLPAGALLNGRWRERVTQVMKVEVHQLGAVDRALPS